MLLVVGAVVEEVAAAVAEAALRVVVEAVAAAAVRVHRHRDRCPTSDHPALPSR